MHERLCDVGGGSDCGGGGSGTGNGSALGFYLYRVYCVFNWVSLWNSS